MKLMSSMAAVLVLSCAANDKGAFNKTDVERDIRLYIDTVFGVHPPTYGDYARFEGGGNREFDAIAMRCVEMFGEGYSDRAAGLLAPKCDAWCEAKGYGKLQAESIYYRLLRDRLHVNGSALKVEKIWAGRGDGAAFSVRVVEAGTDRRIEIFHVSAQKYRDVSWMGVLKVDDVDVDRVLGLDDLGD